jgi:hypothetical protein
MRCQSSTSSVVWLRCATQLPPPSTSHSHEMHQEGKCKGCCTRPSSRPLPGHQAGPRHWRRRAGHHSFLIDHAAPRHAEAAYASRRRRATPWRGGTTSALPCRCIASLDLSPSTVSPLNESRWILSWIEATCTKCQVPLYGSCTKCQPLCLHAHPSQTSWSSQLDPFKHCIF